MFGKEKDKEVSGDKPKIDAVETGEPAQGESKAVPPSNDQAEINQFAEIEALASAEEKASQEQEQQAGTGAPTGQDLKPIKYDQDGTIAGMFNNLADFLRDRPSLAAWAMTEKEAVNIGESAARLLAKYLPALASRSTPELAFGSDLALYALPRLMTGGQEAAQDTGKEADGHQRKPQPTE